MGAASPSESDAIRILIASLVGGAVALGTGAHLVAKSVSGPDSRHRLGSSSESFTVRNEGQADIPDGGSVDRLAAGDLGLNIPISRPECDGMGIVVFVSLVTPGMYAAEVQRGLSLHPGSSYLRTDQACPSLRQATEEGNPIYAVYQPAGYREDEVCDAVRSAGNGAYGKWLNTVTPPDYVIPC